MIKIPTHKISDTPDGEEEIAFLKYVPGGDHSSMVNYPHRDDYFLFVFIEKGTIKVFIDFEECDIKSPAIHCVLPGQVHHVTEYSQDIGCWVLAMDGMLVKDEYKEIFRKLSPAKNKAFLNKDVTDDLKYFITILHRRLKSGKQLIEKSIIHSLLSSYVGIVAEIYQQKGLPVSTDRRPSAIAFQFKSLLSAHYQSLKSPSQYAKKLNISPIYLNEIMKKTTGLTVGECIQNEIIIQAKRLLIYTDKSVKEIALDLGYEDWAYFTRLFTKSSSHSPTQFRRKNQIL